MDGEMIQPAMGRSLAGKIEFGSGLSFIQIDGVPVPILATTGEAISRSSCCHNQERSEQHGRTDHYRDLQQASIKQQMDREVKRRGLDLYSTGRYASRKEAEKDARERIEREKVKASMARTVFIAPLGAILPGGMYQGTITEVPNGQ